MKRRRYLNAGNFSMAVLMMLMSTSLFAQKQLVQVKTFDQQLSPLKNIEVSVNNNDYFLVGNKGVAIVELSEREFPLKSVRVKDEKLEAASWNYSKGTLEIIIRKKSYQLAHVTIRDKKDVPMNNVKVTFSGRKNISAVTDAQGRIEIPLALDERILSHEQFSVPEFRSVKLQEADGKWSLHVEPVHSFQSRPDLQKSSKTRGAEPEYFDRFDLSMLDSIESLTAFYAIFKNHQIKDMNEEMKRRIDAKFNQLVLQFQDSIANNSRFMGKISDSSFVNDDIGNLLSQAAKESQTLEGQREEFDKKITLIQSKLSAGISTMDEETRNSLLSDLTRLENILIQNERLFYKNQNDYRSIINSLKEKYFDITDLENRLSVSEAQRLEEQRAFRKKLLITLSVLLVFAALVLLLIYFSDKLKKQKKELVHVNAEINRINENLENLVAERTKLLEEANKELDTFLYRASHDLRSPVCSIIGLCNIALHLSNGESKDLVERVVLTTSTMDKLLKKLSIISEINQPTNHASITLADLIDDVKGVFSKTIQQQKIKFVIDCPADLVIYSYPNLIETILINLIDNAIFYSVMKDPGNARVELTAEVKNDHVEITLYDNGIGIDETISDRLYDMFFKGHENSKGNGLGLYIVQKSVQALEGKIELQSEFGKFTRFVVRLPMNSIMFQSYTDGANAMELQKG